jgi:HlyD family secretion protein
MLVTAVVLMCVTSIDRIVVSVNVGGPNAPGAGAGGGRIVTKSELLNVYQPLDNSIIKSIDVREGDHVTAGQLLATLDRTFADADVYQYRLQLASLEAQIARDEAELAGLPLKFRDTTDADFLKYQEIQKDYYTQHVSQYAAQINSFDFKIKQLQVTIEKYRADLSAYTGREWVAAQIEQMRGETASNGAGSRLNLLLAQDTRLETVRLMDFSRNSLAEAEQTVASTKADREAFIRQWAANLGDDLVKVRGMSDAAKAQYEKAIKHQDLVRVTAAEPAVVLTLAKVSVGSVLQTGSTLFTLMPLNAPLEAEATIGSQDVGFIRPGDPCVLKVDAFNYIEHGTAEGTVRWISEGAFNTNDAGQAVPAYYKVRCSIDSAQFRGVPENFRLIPGMTLEADIKIGTRSVAVYLLGGMLRHYEEAMRER